MKSSNRKVAGIYRNLMLHGSPIFEKQSECRELQVEGLFVLLFIKLLNKFSNSLPQELISSSSSSCAVLMKVNGTKHRYVCNRFFVAVFAVFGVNSYAVCITFTAISLHLSLIHNCK